MATRDLVGLSRQVLYDFEMVEALAKRLIDVQIEVPQPAWRERFNTTDADVKRSWFETNALLESLLIHARNLSAFLYDSPPSAERQTARAKRGGATRMEDGFAEHYFDNPADWRASNARGKRPKPLVDLDNRVSREVAHVTYHRAEFEEGGPDWGTFSIYTALADVMERFAQRVDPARVCENFRHRVEAALMPKQQPHRPNRPVRLGGVVPPGSAATQGMPPD